ncbi:Hypothetical protein, putative [Bodo saltans]|uniref:PPPDE domain-containing protein n=1 Tax=Bodo saltans TaxID=75058 RepID=A0A0S4J986_BODSA|nr:Hypothetical protein, putative [Bodo saltans]|eukprot:CUG87982.1 Hypothetical protein, putative [Bodo saltans]
MACKMLDFTKKKKKTKGCTRFGKQYEYVHLGRTTMSLREFEGWLVEVEREQFQMAHYHPLQHNCHHFTLFAAQKLLGKSALIEERIFPSYLFHTLDVVCGSVSGKLIAPLMARYTGGVQRVVLDQLLHHDAERQLTQRVASRVAMLANCEHSPPPRCVILHQASPEVASRSVLRLSELTVPEEGARFYCNDHIAIRRFAQVLLEEQPQQQYHQDGASLSSSPPVMKAAASSLSSSSTTISSNLFPGSDFAMLEEFHVLRLVTLLEQLTNATPMTAWEPILEAWRCAALHPQALIALVYSSTLGTALLRACVGFVDLPDGAKIALLRVLCNYAAAPHGAASLCDGRRVHTFVTVIGVALTWPTVDPAAYSSSGARIVELGACLALNVSVAMVVMTKTSISRELKHHGEGHAVCRLMTILLAILFVYSPESVEESVKHVVLLTLYHLTSSSADLTEYMIDHPYYRSLNVSALSATLKTEPCRKLLLMLSIIDELCLSEGDEGGAAPRSDGDVEEDIEELVAEACDVHSSSH